MGFVIGTLTVIVVGGLALLGALIYIMWYCVNSWADVFTTPGNRGKWKK